MKFLVVKEWKEYQHYKDRDPPWIKLYKNLFTTEAWLTGTDISRLVQVASTLLAARYNNKTPYVWDVIRKVTNLDCSEQSFDSAVRHLVGSNFLEIQLDVLTMQSASNEIADCATTSQSLYSEKRREETEERESQTHAREVPRGPKPEISPTAAYASLMDDWRRDVPECNPAAFQKWIVHVESQGKPLGSQQRLLQARRLAGNGDFPAQAEVVDYCIEQGWKTLVPLRDVRKRTQGMSRPDKPVDRPKEEREAEDSARLRELRDSRASRGLADFREPYPIESANAYETALRTEANQRGVRPQSVPAIAALAAAKRINA